MTDAPLTDIALTTLDGRATTLAELGDRGREEQKGHRGREEQKGHRGREEQKGNGAVLVVNVASKCGLTPQYSALEQLAKDYGDRGLTVVGVPCNQFMGQEPGTAEEIATFCSATYGVTFPLLAKTDVNGPGRHPLYAELTKAADGSGEAGDIQWNFEKFLLAPGGTVANRFRPRTVPDDPEVIAAIEKVLPR